MTDVSPHIEERAPSSSSPSTSAPALVDLSRYDNSDYHPGRGRLVRALWYCCSAIVLEGGWLPIGRVKIAILRLFGARIGDGVVIKPHVRIKYPWRLSVGDHCWVGQETWIDNLADVTIGDHVCISQKAYLCTGSHDHRQSTFDLLTGPIAVGNGAWLGARCTILQHVTIGANAIVASGSVVHKDVDPAAIVGGNPAQVIAQRVP